MLTHLIHDGAWWRPGAGPWAPVGVCEEEAGRNGLLTELTPFHSVFTYGTRAVFYGAR